MARRIRPSVEIILSPSSSLFAGVGTSLSNRAGLRAGRAPPTARSGRWVGLQLGQRCVSGDAASLLRASTGRPMCRVRAQSEASATTSSRVIAVETLEHLAGYSATINRNAST